MTLTLTIANADRLSHAPAIPLVLDGCGASIGRSPRCDWMLPDPERFVSSRHCEVAFVDGGYILSDLSTNGTKLNGARERMKGPRRVEHGDRFAIGRYDVVAAFLAPALATTPDVDDDAAPATIYVSGKPRSEPIAAIDPSPIEPGPIDPGPIEPGPIDPGPIEPGPIEPGAVAAAVAVPIEDVNPAAVTPDPAPPAPPPAPAPAPPVPDPTPLLEAFAAGTGLGVGQFKGSAVDTVERAGLLLRHLVTGLAALVEARARAKADLGAEPTALGFDGNNPIAFARRPEHALAQLLNPTERGFMNAVAAVDDAFSDVQAHQQATLRAMQRAMRATLDRFSPAAIRERVDPGRLTSRIMPGAREAALWQAYEREFAGGAGPPDEAFMEVFAREFRQAYLDSAGQRAE